MLRALVTLGFCVSGSLCAAFPPPSSALSGTHTVCNIAWNECKEVPSTQVIKLAAENLRAVQASPPLPSADKAQVAAELLATLSANPFDEVAQNKARAIVQSCATSKDVKEMYTCTGFLVTPQVRLQCLKLGACLPMDFTVTVMNAPKEWQRWFTTYSEQGPNAVVAFARPWVASRSQVKSCGSKSTKQDGSLDESKFTFCMIDGMGGAETLKARKCYAKHAGNPAQFGPCLVDAKLNTSELKAVNCVMANPDNKADCMKDASSPTVSKVINCLELAKSDVSIFGKCVQGTRVGLDNLEVAKVKNCAKEAATSIGTAQDYGPLLKCAVDSGAGADLIHAYQRNKQFADCGTKNVNKPLEAAACLKASGVNLPREVAIASCLKNAKDEIEIFGCTGAKLPREIEVANQCKVAAGQDPAKLALCVAGNLGLSSEQQRYLNCAQKGSLGGAAACMAAPYGSKDFGLAMHCVAETGADPAGTALCMAGPKMNAELRIAAECAASTGGEPVSFAGCAGGRLAFKELQQCISGNWNAENGCFGENNAIVQYYANLEKGARGILRAAGLEGAYDNMLKDIKSGKLGKNNEIVRIFNALNAVVMNSPEEAARQIADEAAKYGKALFEGIGKLGEEAVKAQKQVENLIKDAAPMVPSVSISPDRVKVSAGPGSVEVSGSAVTADVGPVHIHIGF